MKTIYVVTWGYPYESSIGANAFLKKENAEKRQKELLEQYGGWSHVDEVAVEDSAQYTSGEE